MLTNSESLLALSDVARLLNVCEATAWQLTRRGTLPGIRVGRQWRFRRSDIDRYLENQLAKAGSKGAACR
jgi:excisionase family DNA binding protein